MTIRVIHGDSLMVLPTLEPASIDAIVTDPPYGFGMLSKKWDTFSPDAIRERAAQRERKGTERSSKRWPGKSRTTTSRGAAVEYDESASGNQCFQAWCEAWAGECLRVLKPGGHLIAFGGPRTFHRLTAGIEDAGFEVRDCLVWLFGSGFPKSHNLPGGLGTALKPGWEPIVLARKPLIGTVAKNVEQHKTGGLNIDACRIAHASETDRAESESKNQHTRYANPGSNRDSYSGDFPPRGDYDGSLGRWPANVVLDREAAALLDAQGGVRAAGNHPARRRGIGFTENGGGRNAGTNGARRVTELGGASRFFYCAKASRRERNAGLEGLPVRLPHDAEPNGRAWDIPGSHSTARANHHPTVKPLALCRWLVRLVTPPGGVVLDPFAGSGTTGVACVLEERNAVLIEREAEYVAIAEARVRHAQGPLFTSLAVAQ